MKTPFNPLSFLESKLESLKTYIDGYSKEDDSVFKEHEMQTLESELRKLLSICVSLNKNTTFIESINAQVNTNGKNASVHTAEQFILSELLSIYQLLEAKESPKSRFVLAYYHDVLTNNHFVRETDRSELIRYTQTEEFKAKLTALRHTNSISSTTGSPTFFFSSNLREQLPTEFETLITHYERFIQSAFDLHFKSTEDRDAFFQFDSTAEKTEKAKESVVQKDETLDDILAELNELIGLDEVKKDISDLINFLEIQKKRKENNLNPVDFSLHMVFYGPPGTGKTTVARLIGRIYKHLGILSSGHTYETDREGLVAAYVGQTAAKVNEAVLKSMGGVLFIDEAYALNQPSMQDYGAEAINTLLKRMEDNREDLVVIVAGYTEPMKLFIESNPGLKSRFARHFKFEHFQPLDLLKIFELFCKKSDFQLTDASREKLEDIFNLLYEKRDDSFGNARVARNLFEKCVQRHANRVVSKSPITMELLKMLEEQDIPEPKEVLNDVFYSSE